MTWLPAQKKYLVLAFLSGFLIMATELIATRITAPYIGASIFTWTAIISVILLGISIGNYLGGYLADRGVSLTPCLILGSISITTIPLLVRLAPLIAMRTMGIIPIALIVASFLFLGPAILLGTIYPAILKRSLASEADAYTGRTAGLLSGSGALGSIVGTLATGFFFIGFFGSVLSLHMLAGILFLVSLWFESKISKIIVFGTVIIAILLVIQYMFPSAPRKNIVYDTESSYYKISVVDRPFQHQNSRVLFLDLDSHSVETVGGERIGTYQDLSPIFKIFNADLHRILTIGSGSYNIAKDLFNLYRADMTVVEIDPKVTETARTFFNLNGYPIRTVIADGRFYLETTTDTYDLIFGDAFNSFISIPWYLTTKETTITAKKHLNPGGIYVLSVISALEGTSAGLFNSIAKTFSLSFPNYYVISLGKTPDSVQSIVLIGINSDKDINHEELTNALFQLTKERNFPNQLTYHYQPKIPADTIILTDDYAPVERLGAPLVKRYLPDYIQWFYAL